MTLLIRSLLIGFLVAALSIDPVQYYSKYLLHQSQSKLQVTKLTGNYYLLQGDIGYRDCDKVKKVIRGISISRDTSIPVISKTYVFLDSSGGNVAAAICIGEYLSRINVVTIVSEDFSFNETRFKLQFDGEYENNGVCASACTYIFLSGKERRLVGDVFLGIHNPNISTEITRYINSDSLQETTWASAARLVHYLDTKVRSTRLKALFFSIPYNTMLWVSPKHIEKNAWLRPLATEYIDFWDYDWKSK